MHGTPCSTISVLTKRLPRINVPTSLSFFQTTLFLSGGGNFVEAQQLVAIELILPLAAVQLRLQLRLQLSELVENADYFGLDGEWGKGNSIVSDN